jgi:apolipoprotein N-acyltransferase
MSTFIKGDENAQIASHDLSVAVSLCYEVAYADRFYGASPHQLLITLTDDAWFGHSFAMEQHLQIAQFRALENGRMLLMDSNNGITAVISAQGDILKTLPAFSAGSLSSTVWRYEGETPWYRLAHRLNTW